MQRKKNLKGFTLIELLVVIAILGLLATLAIVSLRSAQQRARDTKKLTDAKSLQTAVELYYSEHSSGYPVPSPTTWAGLDTLLQNYLTGLPTPPDPVTDAYVYGVDTGTKQNYVIGVTPGLEDTTHQALTQDADGTFGNGGTTENWGSNSLFVKSSSGAAANPLNCADPVYCLVE